MKESRGGSNSARSVERWCLKCLIQLIVLNVFLVVPPRLTVASQTYKRITNCQHYVIFSHCEELPCQLKLDSVRVMCFCVNIKNQGRSRQRITWEYQWSLKTTKLCYIRHFQNIKCKELLCQLQMMFYWHPEGNIQWLNGLRVLQGDQSSEYHSPGADKFRRESRNPSCLCRGHLATTNRKWHSKRSRSAPRLENIPWLHTY